MLSVMFIAVRMRSGEITAGKGAPPGWVADAMFACTGAVMTQLLMCCMMPLFLGTDADGNQVVKSKFLAAITSLLRYAALLSLYGGVVVVCIGLFFMTPEQCTGKGSVLMPYLYP